MVSYDVPVVDATVDSDDFGGTASDLGKGLAGLVTLTGLGIVARAAINNIADRSDSVEGV